MTPPLLPPPYAAFARFAGNPVVRTVFALGVVLATYNPSGYSYWQMIRSGSFTPVDAVTGIILLCCWLTLLSGCVRMIRRVGSD